MVVTKQFFDNKCWCGFSYGANSVVYNDRCLACMTYRADPFPPFLSPVAVMYNGKHIWFLNARLASS